MRHFAFIIVVFKYLALPKSLTLGNVSKLPLLSLNRDFPSDTERQECGCLSLDDASRCCNSRCTWLCIVSSRRRCRRGSDRRIRASMSAKSALSIYCPCSTCDRPCSGRMSWGLVATSLLSVKPCIEANADEYQNPEENPAE